MTRRVMPAKIVFSGVSLDIGGDALASFSLGLREVMVEDEGEERKRVVIIYRDFVPRILSGGMKK